MMTKKPKTAVIAPKAVVYIQLKLPSAISTEGTLSDELDDIILLDVQGEAVEVSEEYSIPILMAAFDVVHRVSPEMVLRLKTGERILLFDHWGVPVLRDEDIIIGAVKDKVEHKKSEGFATETIINLESIWRKYRGPENNLRAVEESIKEVSESIKPAMITTLTGKAPALLFLLAQHLLYGKTGEIWYQENSASKAIRITRL